MSLVPAPGTKRNTLITLGLLVVAGLWWAAPGAAAVPRSEQIANAVAEVNRGAKRTRTLAIDVDLQMGDVEAVLASGTLISDPRGVARLELRSPRGTVERHLMRGADLSASRQGRAVERPRPFLPPFYLLQAASAGDLEGALIDLGARTEDVALGFDGDSDCFVIGGRDRAGESPQPRMSLWVDRESRQIVRIDLPGGARFRFGPPARFGKTQLPSWIDLYVGEMQMGRLTVTGARPRRVQAGAFQPDWLVDLPTTAAPSP